MSASAGVLRLFVALPLPASVGRVVAGLQPAAQAGVRLLAPADLHVTLHFVGSAEVSPVRQALATVGASPFPVRLTRPGVFHLPGQKKILWLGVEADESLDALHAKTGAALGAVDFTPEKRPFRPHVTLARLSSKAPAALADSFAPDSAAPAGVSFECREFALYSSRTDPAGARYEILETYPLGFEG